MSLSPEQQQALNAIAPACIECEKESGVPAAVSAAQWAAESGYGKHMPPNSNNPFGIKAYSGYSGRVLAATHEWFTPSQAQQFLAKVAGRKLADQKLEPRPNGARCYVAWDWFATFPALADAFKYRSRLLMTSPLYAAAVREYQQNQDVSAFIDGISKRYATDPDYAEKLKDLAFGPSITHALDAAAELPQAA